MARSFCSEVRGCSSGAAGRYNGYASFATSPKAFDQTFIASSRTFALGEFRRD